MDMIPSVSASISDRPVGPSKTDRKSACLDKSCDVNQHGSGSTHDLEIFLVPAHGPPYASLFLGVVLARYFVERDLFLDVSPFGA